MRLKEKNLLQKFAATLKKFSAQGAKKVEYGKSFYEKFTNKWFKADAPYTTVYFRCVICNGGSSGEIL